MRGAVSPLAIQIPKLSPHPPPPPPPSHGLSAISLAEQLAQHALLQLGRRALRLAARLQAFKENLLKSVRPLPGRQIFRWSRISRSSCGVSSRSRNSYK